MSNLLKYLYDELTWPIQEKWIGTLQAAAVVRSLYLSWTLKKHVRRDKKYNILDAGSGEGASLTIVQARRFNESQFVAVDLYQKGPSKQHLPIPSNISFVKKDLFKYVGTNQHDVIVCLDVLEHIDNYRKILSLFYEWLKPDGKLIVHVPSAHQIRYLTKNDLLKNTNRKQRLGDYHVRTGFESEEILKDIQNAGFNVFYRRYTFSAFTWFSKELFSIFEKKSLPGIGIMMLPFIWFSAKAESLLELRRGNGILIVAKKQLKK
jgi:2-polyprenyl-3-methyl-5-hydroxy-6-metoxy-1,4-benzoquinol methylase